MVDLPLWGRALTNMEALRARFILGAYHHSLHKQKAVLILARTQLTPVYIFSFLFCLQ